MTYQDLLNELQGMTEEQLLQPCTAFDTTTRRALAVDLMFEHDDDLLPEGNPYFIL